MPYIRYFVTSLLLTATLCVAHPEPVHALARDTTIPALLRSRTSRNVHGPRGIINRQNTCDIGEDTCPGGEGCCPIGQFCGTFGGKLGCCPIGETCVANDDPCEFQGDVVCPGENFCCPSTTTCIKDSSNTVRCKDGSSASGSSGSGGGSSGGGSSGGGSSGGGSSGGASGGAGGGSGSTAGAGAGAGASKSAGAGAGAGTGTSAFGAATTPAITGSDTSQTGRPAFNGAVSTISPAKYVSCMAGLALGVVLFS